MKNLFNTFLFLFCLILITNSYALTQHYIQTSHNDEIFIINDEIFEAQTYCFNMEEGDPVIFLDGTAASMGVCVLTEILNRRTNQVCKVWCE
ncbi:hypothetical protein N9554_01990 [Candidatus Thioglobus sp.]|nr:hypothetical protein [Candidatus Thioglobus sp.]|tara:strand:- start:218 stop:493 length:276 start_codon:yes stop_codon:yes gene_type:complete